MIIRKHTFNVKIEVLAVESAPALLSEVAEHIRGENTEGTLSKTDGDTATWVIKIDPPQEV